MEINLYY